jgi:hypothetical protein
MTAENVHSLYSPDADAMRQHLEHLFGGYLDGCHDGLIELAWTDTQPNKDGRYALRNAMMFGTDQIEELIEEAARLNLQPNCNVYIGAALRKPGTFPGGRASAGDVLALTCSYVDLDDEGATAAARDRYGEAKAKPTIVVVTGRHPHTRAQMWWRLDEPIIDQKISEALLRGMAAALGGDSSVTDPPRVMRLAGSIAWPVKPDRKIELTSIAPLKEPGQPVYTVGHLARLFPPVHNAAADCVRFQDDDGVTRGTSAFGMEDKVEDGRERYMVKTINAVLIQLIGETGKAPTAQELFDTSWEQYQRGTDFTRPGRGQKEYAAKCVYTVKRFHEGKIRGCETIEIVQARYREKQQARRAPGAGANDFSDEFEKQPNVDPVTGEPLPLLLSAEQFVAGFTPPAYLVDGVLQRGYLYSLTARTGHGKTAVGMYIAQSTARGQPMHGREVKAGTVLLLAGENPDDIRARFLVLADSYGFRAENLKMRFVAGVIDIAARMPEIRSEAEKISDLVLVIVDTGAAYFPGDESNSNSQQGAYARLLRQLTFLPGKPAVLVNCHPVKNASRDNLLPMGGSAFLNEVDGNLTLWATADRQTTLHWQGKFRGPEFEPMTFELEVADSTRVIDAEGRLMPSVVAKPVSELKLQMEEGKQESEENSLMRAIAADRNSSIANLAIKCGFIGATGQPQKSKVHKMCGRLVEEKLLERRGNKYRITPKGKREIGCKDDDDE